LPESGGRAATTPPQLRCHATSLAAGWRRRLPNIDECEGFVRRHAEA
jgi:hypothetical protein